MGSCRTVSCKDFVPCAITCPGLQTTGGPSGETPLMESHVGMLQAFEILAVISYLARVRLLSPSRSANLQIFACHAALVGFMRGQLQHPSSDLQSSLAVCMLLSKACHILSILLCMPSDIDLLPSLSCLLLG